MFVLHSSLYTKSKLFAAHEEWVRSLHPQLPSDLCKAFTNASTTPGRALQYFRGPRAQGMVWCCPHLLVGMRPDQCVRLQLPAQVGRRATLQEDDAAPRARERRRHHHLRGGTQHHFKDGMGKQHHPRAPPHQREDQWTTTLPLPVSYFFSSFFFLSHRHFSLYLNFKNMFRNVFPFFQ